MGRKQTPVPIPNERPFAQIATVKPTAAYGQKQTITWAGQPISVHDNPWPSGDFQLLTWVRMLGSGLVIRENVGRSTSYEEGDNPSVVAVTPAK